MNEREALILRRAELLELEAGVQRAALVATIAQWEQKKTLSYASSLSSMAMKLLRIPRVRWMLLASVLTKIRSRKSKTKDKD
jgi:hypothetical protein